MTANGEVPAKEEATVYVRELDSFVTAMLLEDTQAVPSLGKLCEEFGYSYHWTSGQEPPLIKRGKKIHCDTSNHEPFRRTWFVHEFLFFIYFSYIFIAGNCD